MNIFGIFFTNCIIVFYLILPYISFLRCRDITSEDIRDAITSLAHMIRNVDNKFERYEHIEKQQSDWIKKALIGINNKNHILEMDLDILRRIDERLANVETVFLKRSEQNEAIGAIDAINSMSAIVNEFLPEISFSMHDLKNKQNNSVTKQELLQFENNLLTKIEQKLQAYFNSKSFPNLLHQEFVPKVEHAINFQDIYKSHEDLAGLRTELKEIKLSMNEISQQQLKVFDFWNLTSKALELIDEKLKQIGNSNENVNSEIQNIEMFMQKSTFHFVEIGDHFNKTLDQFHNFSTNLLQNMSRNYDTLQKEIGLLDNIDKVILQTADNVLDTKRRIEFGSHKMILELGEVVKVQAKMLNETVNDRFDNIEVTILNNQSDALSNLTTKLETEMSQVWRQIGIMYEQVSASNNALDRLQEQTELYVNGSVTTMDSMTNKVSLITSRMSEVDSNLNYLLGRLSLVTQEFNKIKNGLGAALENIRTSFVTVKKQLKDIGPGPHYVASDETNE